MNTEDLKAAYKIALTQFRGSRWLVPGLRDVWYDRELTRAINRLERPFIPFFLFLFGLAAAAALGMKLGGTNGQTAALIAMAVFTVIDVLFITPLLFYAVLPKPVAPHIKRIDSLSEEDRQLYEEERTQNERVEKLVKRYTVPKGEDKQK